MKLRKIASLLLAVIMAVGLLPMSVFAAGNGDLVGTATGGSFVDESADPNKSYEYTIEGNDGSKRTVLVAAVADSTTGNSVVEHTTGGVYYEKVTDPANLGTQPCLLVSNDKAVTNTVEVQPVTIDEAGRINNELRDCEWTVTYTPDDGSGNGDQLKFQRTDGKVLTADKNNVLVQAGEDSWTIDNQPSGMRLKRDIPGILDIFTTTVYLRLNKTAWSAETKKNKATTFDLYSKVEEITDTNYTVDTTGLDALLAKNFEQNQYTEDSWKAYADAKAAAETAKKQLNNSYSDKSTADTALAEINKAHTELKAAMDALKMKPVAPGTCVKPEITWHRTWESGHEEKPVQNIQHLVDKDPWMDISWEWDQINGLTASDPDPWNANGNKAATWDKGGNGSWTDSSVRRFTGTFTWPEGVGLDGKMTIQSVNDSNYQFIYDYIEGNPKLKARYGDSKVLPINDDMYVFISKVSDGDPTRWTRDQARLHLAFWTGTSGKGIWSKQGSTDADWGRMTPAQFQGVNATPAYHQSWPNLVDTGVGTNNDVEGWNLDGQPNPMTHTDGWYTLTDTNAMMSTLNSLYANNGGIRGGEQMRIDIYAFDNSESGGMDKLQLTLCAAAQTTAQVTVQYWLDAVGGTNLGQTVMTKNIGEIVNLSMGTNSNELNHKKAAAIAAAGAAANVSDGVQQKIPHTVVEGENVIDVVYTGTTQGLVTYTYDFGVENRYIYPDTNNTPITNVRVDYDTDTITDTIGATFNGHEITLTYKPKDALGKTISATLVVERLEGEQTVTNEYPIAFIPASNVLYEEDFIEQASNTTGADWSNLVKNSIGVVTDNHTTVFGYSDAYKNSAGENGVWTATVTADAASTSDLEFHFNGTGLDVIGSCGPNTGTLVIRINDANGQYVRGFVVDTKFVQDIAQVPLMHITDLEEKEYEVVMRGVYTPPSQMIATRSLDPAGTISPELYDVLVDMGLSDEEIEQVEFIGMEDQLSENTPMLMSMAPAADETVADETAADEAAADEAVADETAADEAAADEAVADETAADEAAADEAVADETAADEAAADEAAADETAADETVTDATATDEAAADTAVTAAGAAMTVSVDGFRVYRGSVMKAYPTNEQNVIYTNVMKDGITGNITAYVEPTGDGSTQSSFAVTEYESKGGPENEIYLAKNQAIVLQLSDSRVRTAQISARAVSGATRMNEKPITHNTEMYYVVDGGENGRIAIVNTGDDLLALGNLKAACGITTINDQEAAVRAVAAVFANSAVPTEPQVPETTEPQAPETTEPEVPETTEPAVPETTEPEVPETTEPVVPEPTEPQVPETTEPEENKTFAPKMLQVSLSVRKGLFAKYATLNVTASKDVAYITINGTRVDARNELLVRLGLNQNYKFRHFEGFGRRDAISYEVVAYDHNGNASKPIVKQN